MIIAALVLLGLCFGSFVNALVWRLHKQSSAGAKESKKYSISKGRSMCVNCGHRLTAADLLPVVSWLTLRGKCRYCHQKISWQYPVVELATATLFVVSYLFWPEFLSGLEIAAFGLWLISLAGLIALVVYDIRWMLLPNKVVFPLYGVAVLFVAARMLHEQSLWPLIGALLGVLIGGGLFYVLFQVSKGKWIGGGDVKLGFLLGALVGGPLPALMLLFFASLLGSIIGGVLLASKKASRKTRIPFGPFLIAAAIITILFGQQISEWYVDFFILY